MLAQGVQIATRTSVFFASKDCKSALSGLLAIVVVNLSYYIHFNKLKILLAYKFNCNGIFRKQYAVFC